MAQHTQGPLEILDGAFGTIIVADDTNDIAEFFHCDEATVSTSREEALANARLFVAAGGLLEALKVLASRMPDTSAVAERHLVGFLAGYRAGIRELEAHIAEYLGAPRP